MPARCIMIFPDFEKMALLEAVREKYDPLYRLIRPHITLVFPFQSEITAKELASHLRSALAGEKAFSIVMGGISGRREAGGNYLFLNVKQGAEEIRLISGKLYGGILSPYKSARYDASYTPHITLGQIRDMHVFDAALKELLNFGHVFSATAREVAVEMIGEDGSSTIEAAFPLL